MKKLFNMVNLSYAYEQVQIVSWFEQGERFKDTALVLCNTNTISIDGLYLGCQWKVSLEENWL